MMRVGQFLRLRAWRCRALLAVMVTAALLFGALLMDGKRPDVATRPVWMAAGNCTPRTNIAFLKSHKCASSAIQNILFRYGLKHNLYFALPDRGNYFGGGRQNFKAEMVRLSVLNKMEPNIFAIHTKWDHDEVRKVMPEDTVYFTIVREPSALFQSLFVYSDFEKKKGMTIDEFVREVAVDAERVSHYIGYNQMTWDFGMPKKNLNNITAVREMVARAEDQFGLVVVAERMEESLVLLAKYLCWELSDMVVLRLNSLRDELKQPLSPATRQLLQQKLAPDYLVYRHFVERFERQVEAFGRARMAAAVTRLREMKALLSDTCGFVRTEATKLNNALRPWSNLVDGFADDGGSGCSLYILPELRFIEKLRKKQMKEVIKRFGMQPGPPLDAIPLAIGQDGKVSEKDLENLKKTLVHKDNTRKKISGKRATGPGGKYMAASDGGGGGGGSGVVGGDPNGAGGDGNGDGGGA
ncbi:galactose-3-O-sulfotransferase 2-like [Eriocheir sinensis]|uniref:galactose-3-O-sulfotransferase 2-like n=1 Tax=Eriocheir sinensis TaxID=95602 RepID=UPI0021C8841E|nr:galactose-3-O-sulfotransferase 2-like [Eriocheir sinensis]